MAWEKFNLMSDRLPAAACAYAVFFDDGLVYIGSSVDVRNRFSEHKIRHGYSRNIVTPWGDVPDQTKIILKIKRSRRLGDWAMWEIRLIQRLRPSFNKQHIGRKNKNEQA
jgi:hypothetical protein